MIGVVFFVCIAIVLLVKSYHTVPILNGLSDNLLSIELEVYNRDKEKESFDKYIITEKEIMIQLYNVIKQTKITKVIRNPEHTGGKDPLWVLKFNFKEGSEHIYASHREEDGVCKCLEPIRERGESGYLIGKNCEIYSVIQDIVSLQCLILE